MKQEDVEALLSRYATQIDELQIEVAALGTAVRALLDMAPDKIAAANRFTQVMNASLRAPMSEEQKAAHSARHEALCFGW
ncbi:hypothetical protein GO497_21880 [Acidovorax citrulli]|nr:hypothetical protein [Paracidovorax citrulli]